AMSADLTMDNIDDTAENLDFYAGIMPISNSNTNNPTRATMLDDYDATFTGIVSANDGYNNVWISDAAGAYNGVMIYDSSFDALVSVGDEITLAARRDVYSGLTELVDPVLLTIVSFGNSPYGPDTIIGENIEESLNVDTNPGESWEGQLVTIEDVYVESSGSYYYRCTDDSGENYFYIGDNVDYHFGSITMNVGTTYPSVTGVVDWYNSGPYYRLNPRSQDDIVDPPTAVTLSEFTAQYASGELSLYWTTQSEVANAGWNIYRGESEISHQNDETDQINPTLIPGSGTTSEPTDYVFVDDYEVTEGATYWYWIESRNNSGETETFGPISLTIPVEGEDPDDPSNDNYGLFQNYPNPVSNATTISFNLTEEKACKLSIYNTKGQTIKDIYEGSTTGNSFVWDRTDNFGNAVASGIYFYKLEAGSEVYTKKLVVTE
ncbi:MAG TPA: T9SS type A sorting domain-containing protein, partial [Candidatus Cloacimonetes bacterium]|nr:T9SS type A sorting domain-containing protein [Candidatus Cloacimonadota bacterium]